MSHSIELVKSQGDNFTGYWEHSLICTFCQDGSISLRVIIGGSEGRYRPKGVRKIRTAKRFFEALEIVCENTELLDLLEYDKVIDGLKEGNQKIATEIEKKINDEKEREELLEKVEREIRDIINSPHLYSNVIGISNKRLRSENIKKLLEEEYLKNKKLPEFIEIDGNIIKIKE